MPAGVVVDSPARRGVHDLRRARRTARLGRLEWFEVAYRAYLVLLIGGATGVAVAGWIPASPLDIESLEQVRTHGPGIVGLVVAVIWGVGLRSGANGGPVSVETPDVRLLLLAPVPRRIVMMRPCMQRLASLSGTGGAIGGLAGVLAAPRLGGSGAQWAVLGAATGVTVMAGAGALALLVHSSGVPRWIPRTMATALVVAQGVAVTSQRPGPTTTAGDAALWPLNRDASSLVSGGVIAVIVGAATAAALVWCGRLSPEALERRTALVAQLRFAIAVGDLRTVMLLRRQLTHDQLRARPWIALAPPGHRSHATRLIAWRTAVGLCRLPLRRVIRLVVLSVVLGMVAVPVVQGSVALVAVLGLVAFVIGLDLTEGLAQTLDHDEQRQLLPLPAGLVSGAALIVPALLLVLLAGIAVLSAGAVSGSFDAVVVGAVLAVPLMWASASGAVVNVVRGAPDPLVRAARVVSMPPEVAGVSTAVQAAWPVLVSMVGATPLLFVTAAADDGGSLVAAGIRGAVAALLISGTVAWWVRRRDDMRRRWRDLVAAGDQARRDAAVRRRTRTGGQR